VTSTATRRAIARCAAPTARTLAVGVLLLGSTPALARPTRLAITHVTVIDATGAPPRADQTVLVVGGRIARIADSASVRLPTDTRVVDGGGKFLIPGLWDMHVHLGDEAEDRALLARFVARGITGVRIMRGYPIHHVWRREIAAGRLVGPSMFIASPRTYEASTTPEAARRLVRAARREGADFYKVWDDLPRASYLAVVDEARRVGLPVEGHVPRAMTAAEVSSLGQRSIEHFTGLDDARVDAAKADTLAAILVRNRTWMCPTLVMRHGYARLDDPTLTHDPRLADATPSERRRWEQLAEQAAAFPADEMPKRRALVADEDRLVGRLRAHGVGILAGTDFGACPFGVAGYCLHDELALLVAAGLTPMEALQAATRNAATFFHVERSAGTVEVGKMANLVLLDASPLEDIRNTTRIAAIVLGGRLTARSPAHRGGR